MTCPSERVEAAGAANAQAHAHLLDIIATAAPDPKTAATGQDDPPCASRAEPTGDFPMQLSAHFTLAEFTLSQEAARRGIANDPPADLLPALKRTAEGLERVRAALGQPIAISSGYRAPDLNAAVGGAATSQHVKGEAADITCPEFGPPEQVAAFIAARQVALGVDQVILEFERWVHVSFSAAPRHMALTIRADGQGYRPGIVA